MKQYIVYYEVGLSFTNGVAIENKIIAADLVRGLEAGKSIWLPNSWKVDVIDLSDNAVKEPPCSSSE
jgi:hypothetical protein